MADRNDKAFQEFLSEAQEIVEALARDLSALEALGGSSDPEPLNGAFRSVHSLKGISGLFGLGAMTGLAHTLESLLDRIRLGKVTLSTPILDLLFESVELFAKIVAELSEGNDPDAPRINDYLARLEQALAAPHPERAPPSGVGGYDLDPAILGVLTEYEEHRLRESIKQGKGLYRIKVAFDLTAIETGLDALKARIKVVGEVLSYLPSAEMRSDNTIELDVLVAAAADLATMHQATAGLGVIVEEVPRVGRPVRATRPPPKLTPPPSMRPPAQPPPSMTPTSAGGVAASATPAGPSAGSVAPGASAATQSATGGGGGAGGGGGGAPSGRGELSDDEGAMGSLRSVTQTVRVDIRKLDALMNVLGELTLARVGITQVLDELRQRAGAADLAQRLHRELRALERRVDELQGGILEVRMVPLGQVFDKLSRVVRRVSRDAGKDIRLLISGADTELDKLIVEELSDPLMHIIRNAIDHGIESIEARRRAGKPEQGTIAVSASQKGNHVVIGIADDGGGFDEERILETALKKGLIDTAQAADLSRRDLYNLVFLPGFSTRETATELSGRGVGMDVVKTNIAKLSGLIDVRSRRGEGTEITITLPITLAIIQALVVRAAGRTYAVPLASVLESMILDVKDQSTLEGREVISLRGQTLALVRLDTLFELGGERPAKQFVVIVGLAQHRLGLVVDELIGQQDVVIKSLGKVLSGIPGVAGATELGGHETVLVLDVAAIIEEALHVSIAEAA
jgi:two-component system chemotaxis sensor kinase CheA